MAEETKQTRDERISELLAKSAKDVVDSIKGPSLGDLTQPIGKTEEGAENIPDAEVEDTQTGGKKVRIPASRLKTLTSEIKELRERTQASQKYEERIAVLESQIKSSKTNEDDLPDWWKAAYGDTDVSKQGYRNQQRIMREELSRSMADMERAREQAETEREERVQSIESSFDEQMDNLEESLGRELTGTQKAEILDIVGEYSPMENDRYLAYLPIEKAYDIWNKTQGQSKAKESMADIAGMSSTGSTQSISSKERPQMGDWRKRFGL